MTSKTKAELARVLEVVGAAKATGVIRTGCTDTARGAAEAVIRAGFTSIEFTLSIPNAYELMAEFKKKYPHVLVGGGTVLSTEQAEACVLAGCDFIVNPCLEISVVKWCAARNVCIMAGIYTPTEMWEAHKAGAHVAKLFPGAANGPAFIKAVKGPLPFLRILPTTGVTYENCADYMAAGAFGVGFTGVLFDPDDMANKRFDAIEARGRKFLAKVKAAPSLPQPKL